MNYSGLVSVANSPIGLLFYFILALTNLIFGLKVAYIMWTFLGFLGGAGLFLFFYIFIKNHNMNFYFWSIISGVIYSMFCSYNLGAAALPYIILSVYLFTDAIEHKEKHYYLIYFTFVVLSISFEISLTSQGGLLPAILFLSTFLLVFIVLSPSENRNIYLKYAITAIILVVLINISLFASTYLFVKSVGNQFFNKANFLESNVKNVNILDVFYFAFLYLGSNTIINLVMLLLLIIFLFGFIFLVYSFRFREQRQIIFALSISYLVIIFFALTINKPFGLLFNIISNNINYLYAFRYAYSAVSYLFFFTFIVVFSLTMLQISDMLKGVSNYKRNFIIAMKALIVLIFIVYSSFFIYNMGLTNNIGIGKSFFVIPSNTFRLAEFINTNSTLYNFDPVATFPVAYNWQFTKWYYGVNIYSSLIKIPVYTGGYTYYNEIYFPISKLIYSEIGSNVDNNKINSSLPNELGILGIHYVIIQGDTVDCKDCYAPSFNLTKIYLNINRSTNIILVKKFGNSSVYVNNNYVHLVYTSDLVNLGNASTESIFNTLGNFSFNIQNTSVYSTHIDNFYNDSNTINATPIANFTMPDITFIENNPTQVTVHISNATAPYYLVFRETYDPHWVAFYSNGTEVNPHDHIAVNGFANAWYMNKTGNYTITLYYTLQTDAWIAWGVSFVALFVTIGIGIYGWKESAKAKMRRHG